MPQTKKATLFTLLIYPEDVPLKWDIALGTLPFKDAISPIHNLDLYDAKTMKNKIAEMKKSFGPAYVNAFEDGAKAEDSAQARAQFERVVKFYDTFKKLGYSEQEELIAEYDALKKRGAKITKGGREHLETLKPFFKKPHYHVLVDTIKPTTGRALRQRVNRRLSKAKPVKVPEVRLIKDMYDMWQYLSHESFDAIRHHKHVYDRSKIVLLNGFDITDYLALNPEQYNRMASKAFDFIDCEGIDNYLVARTRVSKKLGISVRDFDVMMRSRMPQLNAVLKGAHELGRNFDESANSMHVVR